MAETLRGQVKWFNDAKGFGFIEHTSGKDVFVHYSVIQTEGFKTLKDGEEVEYEMQEGPKGFQALRVERKVKAAGSEAEGGAASDSNSDDSSEDSSDNSEEAGSSSSNAQ